MINTLVMEVKPTPRNELTIEMLRCTHWFKVIKKSGQKTGTPTWDCTLCHRKVKAS